MTVELLTEAPLAPPAGLGPYRRVDYEALPDQPRCELLFGRLYVMPSPTVLHQTVLQLLWEHLRGIARSAGGRAFVAPLDVALADHSVVQPDVIYVAAERLEILRTRIEGAPDLLVEVLSPGTARRDRGEKLSLYARSGIREYWLVEPESRQIEILVNEAGRFVVALPVGGLYRSQQIPEIHLDVAEFWRSVEAEVGPGPGPSGTSPG
jgi:Uma2 family endonuclease